MEGKYTKAGTIIGLVSLLITIIITIISFTTKLSHNLAGEWLMTSRVEKAGLKAYLGSEIQWKMFIDENQNIVKGTAEKIKVNGQELDYNQRTSLEFEGFIDGKTLVINYVEDGKIRKTSGIIKVRFNEKRFSGEFSQTAPSAEGSIIGIKIK